MMNEMYKKLEEYIADWNPDGKTEEELAEIRRLVEFGIKKDWIPALDIKANACYGGDVLYPCDWVTSRDCFLRLTELTEDGEYHNALGYIYYYGRCDGKPDYDRAFKHFSVGAAHGIFESTYKIADMMMSGKGVPKNKSGAARIILGMYDENLNNFCGEHFECKYADVALRVGGLVEQGVGVEADPEIAYFHYLRAAYAIDKRMGKWDFYGDGKVKANIDKAIERCREQLGAEFFTDLITYEAPAALGELMKDAIGLEVEFNRRPGEGFYIKARRYADDEHNQKVLLTIPEFDYCKLIDEAELSIEGIKSITADIPAKAFISQITYDEERNLWEFCHRGQVMFSFSCSGFMMKKSKFE